MQVKIWFQNRRNKCKRQLAAELEAANMAANMAAAACQRIVRADWICHLLPNWLRRAARLGQRQPVGRLHHWPLGDHLPAVNPSPSHRTPANHAQVDRPNARE